MSAKNELVLVRPIPDSWLSQVSPGHKKKKIGLYNAPCLRSEVSMFEKIDIFWKNIPPGKFDPYVIAKALLPIIQETNRLSKKLSLGAQKSES